MSLALNHEVRNVLTAKTVELLSYGTTAQGYTEYHFANGVTLKLGGPGDGQPEIVQLSLPGDHPPRILEAGYVQGVGRTFVEVEFLGPR